ncbi:substrate-binding periplasmic protein [Hahella ganghwensis]|uniref:substrate-binding periplasmic protein n=1 Tax=Hahella ganghwensis TaxID=286420 RepID=UPI000367DF5E|nr:transporter substrate-binding domain-containing protein [Hahella ganghwensis]
MNRHAVKKLLQLLCIIGTIQVAYASSLAENRITLVTTNYPPYEIENPEDGLPGYDVEVIQEAFRRADIHAEILFIPWKRAVRQLRTGDSIAGFSVTDAPERRDMCAFSDPISTLTPVLAVRADYDGFVPKTLAESTKLYGIGLNGYAYQNELKEIGAPHAILTSDEQALLFLIRSRADVFYTAKESTQYIAKSMGISEKIRYLELEDKSIDNFHVCFSKAWPGHQHYLKIFDRELNGMKEDGTYDRIHRKYQ